ncbi:MAG: hypothetical protein ABIN80_16425 [Dyadobacter sp.]|uniref:hypothetical protein n=1 Tax=Dyadobacter sp. TaxID=1914288 RepID=UPI003263E569
MKSPITLLVGLALTFLIASCDSKNESVRPEPDGTPAVVTGAVTPVGISEGTAITANIGPAGGTIQSADERIRITIPAGALATEQTISVQPLSNQCPAGTGQAFRLLPHGQVFGKPVTVTFNYNETDVNGSIPEALRIAYQNDKGIWQYPSAKSLDTTARSVRVESTHFSDWALFQTMYISPGNSFLNPGGNLFLVAFQTPQSEKVGDDFFVPLPSRIPSKHIEKWTLRGGGVLKPNQNQADYHAPSSIPAINPAAVTVFLNETVKIDGVLFKDIRLVCNIFTAPEGLSVQLDGGAWRTYAGGASITGAQNVIQGMDGKESASLLWNGAPTGIFHWTKGIAVAFNLNKGKLIYQHLYGKNLAVSGGSLTVDCSDKAWVVGSFTVQPAGWIDTAPNPLKIGETAVNGVFRVKRVN